MTQQELIRGLTEQKQEAMDELLLRHGPLMRYIISPILPDEREREECLSDVAMRVWEKIGQYDPERGNWLSWLTALTRNTALNRVRQSRKECRNEELPEELTDGENQPEAEVLRKERMAALQKALAHMKPEDRALIYRKYYYLQSTAQIAAELGWTQRAVEGKLYRLKKELRKWLGGDGIG